MATAKKPSPKPKTKPPAEKSVAAKKAAASKKPPAKKAAPKASASDAIDQQPARYRSMRDFNITAEPSGTSPGRSSAQQGLPFVIQKHTASHLHYDFRLGSTVVLKSWATPK